MYGINKNMEMLLSQKSELIPTHVQQQRLSATQKIELCDLYETGDYTFKELAIKFNVSSQAIKGLLNRRGYKAKPQSELQRKYTLNESFFDCIGEEQAYFLGLLYADGYNDTNRGCVNLSLKESDSEILLKLRDFIGSDRPLQYIDLKMQGKQNQFKLVISSRIISNRVAELGCTKAKTFTIKFPDWLTPYTANHFIRGYLDGDGCIMSKSVSFVGTEDFCIGLTNVFKSIGVNVYIRTRHKERNHNIRMLEVGGRRQCKTLLDWLYDGATIFLQRKYDRYQKIISDILAIDTVRVCSVEGCGKKHMGKGFCKKHYYAFCGGVEKRRLRYETLGV